jgi:RNA polymerase sigma-70 factor, ECF subfamily
VQAELEPVDGLIERIAAGDRDALADLYDEFRRPLLSYLTLLTRDRELAEEILQDTLLAVWSGAPGFTRRSSVKSWLFGIARRRARDTLRPRAFQWVDIDTIEVPHRGPETEGAALASIAGDELTGAILRLSPPHQEILVLTFVHGLSYHELTAVLGIPIGTVKSRLNGARQALRILISAEGGRP